MTPEARRGETSTRQPESAQLQRCPVRVRLRGGRTAEGDVHVSANQSLVGFLAMKKTYLNLTSARWVGSHTSVEAYIHLSLAIPEILWVMPLDGSMSLSTALSPTTKGRRVELHLVGGDVLDVTLHISDELRMSSYFESSSSFIPLWGVRGSEEFDASSRLAVHPAAVLAIREV